MEERKFKIVIEEIKSGRYIPDFLLKELKEALEGSDKKDDPINEPLKKLWDNKDDEHWNTHKKDVCECIWHSSGIKTYECDRCAKLRSSDKKDDFDLCKCGHARMIHLFEQNRCQHESDCECTEFSSTHKKDYQNFWKWSDRYGEVKE